MKLVAYSASASWVAGVGALIPLVGWIVEVAGSAYSVYLLYLGLPVLMRCPPQRALLYTIVIVVLTLVLFGVLGAVMGGGAVLDLVGFAAATAHRGIPLVRLPTTSLSQGDGGVGVTNGINFFGKKNWLGSFGVPHAIINDLAFLNGLPVRERRVGLIEAVKVALVRDAKFFEFIAARVEALAKFEPEAFEAVIRESARQHMEHIATAGDPFERGSARPLDFGHWAAHKLEQLSEFRVSHGEAVAVGMAIDLIYARRTGLLSEADAERILGVIQGLGFELFSPVKQIRSATGRQDMLDGLEEFREHLGGRLTIPMIRAPGVRLEIHEMDGAVVKAAFDELRERYG
jgi:3-dehydroquinate synthase